MNVFFEHGGTLKEDEFKEALTELLGPSERYRRQMGLLFQKMDTRGIGKSIIAPYLNISIYVFADTLA